MILYFSIAHSPPSPDCSRTPCKVDRAFISFKHIVSLWFHPNWRGVHEKPVLNETAKPDTQKNQGGAEDVVKTEICQSQ
jgi:hypothetical protein